MADRLGVGIVGAGFVGNFHVRSWQGVRHADILGVCSRTQSRAEATAKAARDLGVGDAEAFTSVTDMVKDPRIDAVWICVPNFCRVEIMEEIVEVERGERFVGVIRMNW